MATPSEFPLDPAAARARSASASASSRSAARRISASNGTEPASCPIGRQSPARGPFLGLLAMDVDALGRDAGAAAAVDRPHLAVRPAAVQPGADDDLGGMQAGDELAVVGPADVEARGPVRPGADVAGEDAVGPGVAADVRAAHVDRLQL